MHKAVFFEGTLHFTLHPDGPLLIKAGESGSVDPSLPDMQFVRTQGDIIYIPGPSLKGVVPRLVTNKWGKASPIS